jgi:hypothetical protein
MEQELDHTSNSKGQLPNNHLQNLNSPVYVTYQI